MRILSFTKPSTNVSKAELDAKTGVLTVVFENGTTYRYANVTEEQAAAWEKSDSVGKWFNSNIKAKAKEHPVIREGEKAEAVASSSSESGVEPAAEEGKPSPSAASDAAADGSPVDFRSVAFDVLLDAKRFYEDYSANSGNKTFDGRAMPSWAELLDKKSPVVSHWCAVVIGSRTRSASDATEGLALERSANARLKQKIEELEARNAQLGRQASKADETAVELAARERTKTLEDECDKLREQVSSLESQLAAKPKPERPWQNQKRG